jgi:adenosyl cobinamide kinase/adenosyl cobinamide phosphate guanylyltransferase
MHSTEFTKPVTAESLLNTFETRFGQTMNLSGMTKEQLEDVANHIRTKIHTLTDNLHFGHELKNNEYQKSQAMLDVVNQAIREYGTGELKTDPKTKAIVKKVQNIPTLQDKEKKEIIGDLVTTEVKEGIEQQSELILAAKDMMDKVTGYLQDLAEMKTEGMLELADRIRDEMGADKADAFVAKIQPAIETAESTLTQTRQDLEGGVRILTGEEVPAEPMGEPEPELDSEEDLDSLDSESDEFGAADAEAGGTEPEGREQRESREVFETTSRILSKLARR